MNKRINSKQKGKRGERAFRDVLREAGYCKAYRGVQYKGSGDSPDVVCPELPGIHWEVKCCERGNPYEWLCQANADCGGSIPIVAHRRNVHPWIAIITMRDLLEIIRRSDLPAVSTCQTCSSVVPKSEWPEHDCREFLDAMGVPPDGKGKISVPVKQ